MTTRPLFLAALALLSALPLFVHAQSPLIVDVVQPQLQPLSDRVEVPGTLLAREAITLRAPVSERVSAVHFHEGDTV